MIEKKKITSHIKGIHILVFIIGMLLCSCSKQETLPSNASAFFDKIIHDFGEIPEKKEASIIFDFENDSNQPLEIREVKTTCGCAAPEWSKEAIKPSEKGSIKVTYDAKYPGRFNKTITVYYNGKNSPQELIIKGHVKYPNKGK